MCPKGSSKKGKFLTIQFYIRTKKNLQNIQPNIIPKTIEKEKQTKPKVNGRNEIIKIRTETKDEDKENSCKDNETES